MSSEQPQDNAIGKSVTRHRIIRIIVLTLLTLLVLAVVLYRISSWALPKIVESIRDPPFGIDANRPPLDQ